MGKAISRVLVLGLGLAVLAGCKGNQALPGVDASFLSFPVQTKWCDPAKATYCPGSNEKPAGQS